MRVSKKSIWSKPWPQTFQDFELTEPSDERGEYILTADATLHEREDYLHEYNEWLYDVKYYLKEPATEWMGFHYVNLILTKEIRSTPEVYMACEQFKWRYENQGTERYPYVFDVEAAYSDIVYGESNYNIVTNEGIRKPLIYQTNQHFRLGQLSGWRRINRDGKVVGNALTKYFDMMGRSNGKTTEKVPYVHKRMLQSEQKGIKLKTLFIAGTKDGSKDPYDVVKEMTKNAKPSVSKLFKVHDSMVRFVRKDKSYGSEFNSSAMGANNLHGGATSVSLFDEVHTYKDVEAINTILSSFIKVIDPVSIFTTTRSKGLSFVLEIMVEEGVNALKTYKKSSDYDTEFYYLAYMSSVSQITNFNNWILANPNVQLQNNIHKIKDYRKHIQDPLGSSALDYWTQNFNLIDTTTGTAFVTLTDLKKNNGTFNFDDIKDKPTYIGIDAAGENDFTYVTYMVPDQDVDGNKKIYVGGKGFITHKNYESKVGTRNFERLEYWVEDGRMELMPNHLVNEEQVYTYINHLFETMNVVGMGADPKGIDYIEQRLVDDGRDYLFERLDQHPKNVNTPLVELQRWFQNHFIYYNNDELLTYFYQNAESYRGPHGDGFMMVRKMASSKVATNRSKIDGLDALVVAYEKFRRDGGFTQLDRGPLTDNYTSINELWDMYT